jgi:hypothetical protein
MVVYTAVTWLEGLSLRAATFAPARAVLALGWTLPEDLSRWADQHRSRPDVIAMG